MPNIFSKIKNRKARVAVIGLGAVGLPLCVEIVKAGFTVTGIDRSSNRIADLKQGLDLPARLLKDVFLNWMKEEKLHIKSGYQDLDVCDVICLAVPTPLADDDSPDLRPLLEALDLLRQYLKPGQAIWVESTLYPGATEEVIRPFLEATGLRAGRDFYLAVSPERLNPGDTRFPLSEIPKLVGGVDAVSTEACASFYQSFIKEVIPLSSARAAEAAKCFENAFRFVNIALVNEFALAAPHLKVDPWEVLEAAATKPFGFMPFSPGPGVGGASLHAASHFLRWKTEQDAPRDAFPLPRGLIETADSIHALMAEKVVEKVEEGLQPAGKMLRGSRLILLGVAYKENVSDTRHSPALRVVEILLKKGADLSYWDPHVPVLKARDREFLSLQDPDLSAFDAAILITPHDSFDLSRVVRESNLLIDPRNAARGFPEYRHKILR